MSDVQKPVEEQPAPVEATPAVEPAAETKVEEPVAAEAPAAPETTAAAEPAPDAIEPAAATETPEAPVKAATPTKKEFTGEGTLGYKAPGGNFLK